MKQLVGKSMTKEQQEEKVCQDRSTIIQNFIKKALEIYQNKNKSLPTMIAIYRDGVGGPSYHEKVIRNEIKDVMSMIQAYSSNYRPQIIYTLIDEGMNTRFAQRNLDSFENPAPGTVVDQGLVEHATT